jgi:hypothetical protein
MVFEWREILLLTECGAWGTHLYVTFEMKPSVPSDPTMRCLMMLMGSSGGKSTSAFRL